MYGEIIAIGDEIISGKVLNTNSNFSARALFQAGYEVRRITSIGDHLEDIKEVIRAAVRRSRFVIVTGGLGPTPDDITNEAVSEALDLPLVENQAIKAILESLLDEYPLSRAQQAKLTHLPGGAEVLDPGSRMAGYMLRPGDTLLFCLPGVPEELEEQIVAQVLPRLRAFLPAAGVILQKTFKVFGLKEPEVHQRLSGVEFDRERVLIGYYPSFPEVHVTITAKGKDDEEAARCFENVKCSVRALLGDFVVAEDRASLAETVGGMLLDAGAMLATAESCTGGLISSMITRVPGSSRWFDRGVVTYSNQSKQELLGVRKHTLDAHGAVSSQTCEEMVAGLRARTGARYFIAVTGIAGPGGGTRDKPVGTVYIGTGTPRGTLVKRFKFKGHRPRIQMLTAETALDLLRRQLMGDS